MLEQQVSENDDGRSGRLPKRDGFAGSTGRDDSFWASKREGCSGRSGSRGRVEGSSGYEGQRSKSESPTKLRLVRQNSHERAGRSNGDAYKLAADERSTRSKAGGADTASCRRDSTGGRIPATGVATALKVTGGKADMECKRPQTRSATAVGERGQRKPTTGIAKSRVAGADTQSGADGAKHGPSRQNSTE